MGCVLMGLCVIVAAIAVLVALGRMMNEGREPEGDWYERQQD